MELKLTLEIDGTRYGVVFDEVDENINGLHVNFDDIIYYTLRNHVAANKKLAMKPEPTFLPAFHGSGTTVRG